MEVTISKGMTWRTWFPKVQEESTNQSTLSQVETWTAPKKWCFPILEISRLQGVIVQVPCKTLGCLTRLDVNMKPFEPFEKKVQIQRHAILMLLDPSQVPGTPKVRYDWTPKTDLKKHHVTGDVYRDYRVYIYTDVDRFFHLFTLFNYPNPKHSMGLIYLYTYIFSRNYPVLLVKVASPMGCGPGFWQTSGDVVTPIQYW